MSVFDIFKKLEEEKTAKAAQPIEWLVVGRTGSNDGIIYSDCSIC